MASRATLPPDISRAGGYSAPPDPYAEIRRLVEIQLRTNRAMHRQARSLCLTLDHEAHALANQLRTLGGDPEAV